MKRITMTMGAVAAAAITGLADPAIIFFTDEVLFNQALVNAGKIFKGIEDFEQAILPLPPSKNLEFLNDPLNINNLQGVFPSFIDNLTFQSNTNGTPFVNDPGVNGPNPRGFEGLRVVGPGFAASPNVGVLANFHEDSLDIISGPAAGGNHTALGMHLYSFEVRGPTEVRVFDKNEVQIGASELTTGLSGQFLGILATGGDTIGRVNIWNSDPAGPVGEREGILDIQTYLIPAPSALALLGLAGLFGLRRRRR